MATEFGSDSNSILMHQQVTEEKADQQADVSVVSCIICTERLGDKGDKGDTEALECMHVYHKTCIQKWFGFKEECPTCRLPVRRVGVSPGQSDVRLMSIFNLVEEENEEEDWAIRASMAESLLPHPHPHPPPPPENLALPALPELPMVEPHPRVQRGRRNRRHQIVGGCTAQIGTGMEICGRKPKDGHATCGYHTKK